MLLDTRISLLEGIGKCYLSSKLTKMVLLQAGSGSGLIHGKCVFSKTSRPHLERGFNKL